MLVNPVSFVADPMTTTVLSIIADGKNAMPRLLSSGLYEIGHFSLEHMLECNLTYEQQYPSFGVIFDKRCPKDKDGGDGYFNCYGVCDSPQQFRELFEELLEKDERYFIVSLTHIDKKKQPSEGGWRWHKWGPYIGTGTPTTEYLYDEEKFENGVWVYHVYEIPEELVANERNENES